MRINADFSQPAEVTPDSGRWVASPEAGVERVMLDRIGDEVARATSLVRYAPHSSFAPHRHDEGEEFLVLEGVFSDEHGDYPAGTYVRNPPGSAHRPSSRDGCTIFVKLRQFDPQDLSQIVIDTRKADDWQSGSDAGLETLELHRFGREQVSMKRLAAGSELSLSDFSQGAEILVVEGVLRKDSRDYPAGSWLRVPAGARLSLSSEAGCEVYVKTGHLPPASSA